MSDDRASPDGDVVANCHARQDGDVAPNPYVVPDGDRPCPFLTGIALYRVSAVTSSIDVDIRADETVVANRHTGFIEDGEVEIGKETFTNTDLLAVVTTERLVDDDVVVTYISQEAF